MREGGTKKAGRSHKFASSLPIIKSVSWVKGFRFGNLLHFYFVPISVMRGRDTFTKNVFFGGRAAF